MDITLGDAVAGALASIGIFVNKSMDELRIKEHGISGEGIDLMQSYYGESTYSDFNVKPKPDFIQARSTKNSIHFIADNNYSVAFQVINRTPNRKYPDKAIKVTINNCADNVIELPMSEVWVNSSFVINKELLNAGANELTIVWPFTFEPLEPKNTFFENHFLNIMFPVLGEIFTITAVRMGN